MLPTQDHIKAAYAQASEHTKGFIDSDELFNTFYALRTKYNLHVDVAGNLALLIDAVILELVQFSQFPERLKEVLGPMSESDYQAIMKTVNDSVFGAFRQKQKDLADKAAQEAREDKALEDELAAEALARKGEPAVRVESGQKTTTAPEAPPAAAAATTAPPPSIVSQKMTAPSAPAQTPTVVTPPQTNAAPPHYHGTDPYRERAE